MENPKAPAALVIAHEGGYPWPKKFHDYQIDFLPTPGTCSKAADMGRACFSYID
jgi:hypothetical protein